MKEAATVLQHALKCIVALGLVIITFGQTYSSLLLHLYGGEFLSKGEGPILLKAHCFSVLLLGVNGITECYSFSTMTAEELNKYVTFLEIQDDENHIYLLISIHLFVDIIISWRHFQSPFWQSPGD